jgi:hypothetical protein
MVAGGGSVLQPPGRLRREIVASEKAARVRSARRRMPEMARTAQPAQRLQLEQMAETWEQLAKARRQQLERQEKTEEDEAAAK